ncbi:hypothetical protein LIY99_22475, partial [Escherichia coli]|nr:hypothetical protein [Escherichia coli]MCB6898146.1 hypothetical protein [Escherichia coli]MCB6923516.1 hypothetical protein [Escherichia coli]
RPLNKTKGCLIANFATVPFEIPEAFVTKEVPLKLAQLRERWERYVVLNAEWAARGRRGFERNPRDD